MSPPRPQLVVRKHTLQDANILCAIACHFKNPIATKDAKVQSSIKEIFCECANAHTSLATIANELSKISDKVTLEEFNLILAGSIQPMIQLNVLITCLSPVTHAPPKTEKASLYNASKRLGLPDPKHAKLADLPHKDTTQILVCGTHMLIRDTLFQATTNKTPRVTLAVQFQINTWHAQKCIMGRFYKSGSHNPKKNP